MAKTRLISLLICLVLVISVFGCFSAVVSAQDDTATPTTTATPTPTAPPELRLKCDVPSYSADAGSSFYYNVDLSYTGNDRITTNLSLTNPQGWTSYMTYSSKEITSLPMGPLSYGSPDSKTLSITLSPASGYTPEPGEYKLNLKATSGDMSATIDLIATVKAKYTYSMTTESGNLATTAVAGQDNHFTILIKNTGSAALDNISFNASKPSDWNVTFNPDKVASLSAGQSQQIDVVISPPEGKTVAGDYMLTLRSNNAKVASSMDVRVTVNTSSIWGVVSIVIIVVVIAGLAVLFLKLGRR